MGVMVMCPHPFGFIVYFSSLLDISKTIQLLRFIKTCLRAIRYIKTSGNATVDHLSKYLAVRLALEELRKNGEASPINVEAASEKQYTIYIPTANNQFTVSDLTL